MATVRDSEYIRGAARLGQRLNTLRVTLALPPMMEEIENLLLNRTLRRFDQEVDPDGRPWRELSFETRKRKPLGSKKLRETGQMRASIKRIKGSAAGAMYAITGAGFRIGIDDPDQVDKGRAHQYGTRHIPVRRFLGIGRLDVKAVDSLLRRKAATATREIS